MQGWSKKIRCNSASQSTYLIEFTTTYSTWKFVNDDAMYGWSSINMIPRKEDVAVATRRARMYVILLFLEETGDTKDPENLDLSSIDVMPFNPSWAHKWPLLPLILSLFNPHTLNHNKPILLQNQTNQRFESSLTHNGYHQVSHYNLITATWGFHWPIRVDKEHRQPGSREPWRHLSWGKEGGQQTYVILLTLWIFSTNGLNRNC